MLCNRPDQADEITMGMLDWITGGDDMDGDGMTAQDRQDFDRLNRLVVKGVSASRAIIEAGEALAEIRERQLYREVADTWEAYLDIHNLTRRRADQMIQAAQLLGRIEEVIEESGNVVPSGFESITERTAREFAGLGAEDAADALIEASNDPDGITRKSIQKAAAKRKSKKTGTMVPKPRRLKIPGAVVTVEFNRKGAATGFDVAAALEAALAAVRQDQQPAREAA